MKQRYSSIASLGLALVVGVWLTSCAVFSASLDGYSDSAGGGGQGVGGSSGQRDAGSGGGGGDTERNSEVVVHPLTHDFGAVPISSTSDPFEFGISNQTENSVKAEKFAVEGDKSAFVVDWKDCDGKTLQSSRQCKFTVQFAPKSLGKKSATISFNVNGLRKSVTVKGQGALEHVISLTPPVVDFGKIVIGNKSEIKRLLLTNLGDSITEVEFELGGTNPDAFLLDSSGCHGKLQPKAVCQVTVQAFPKDRGLREATVLAKTKDGDQVKVQTVVNGRAPAQLVSSPASLDFGYVDPNTAVAQQVEIENVGDEDAQITSVRIDQTPPAKSSGFSISSDGCSGTLSGQSRCTIVVSLTTGPAGKYTGALQVASSGNALLSIPLQATAQESSLEISPASKYLGDITMSYSAPEAPSKTSFVFNVRNTGSINIDSITLSIVGPKGCPFRLVPLGIKSECGTKFTLYPGQSCLQKVEFSEPSIAASPGKHLALLKALGRTTKPSGTVTVSASASLSGKILKPAALTVKPISYDFGSLSIGTSSTTRAFTFKNVGEMSTKTNLLVNLEGVNAREFTLVGNGCNKRLAPGSTCTVTVAYSPTHTGTHSARLKADASTTSVSSLVTGAAKNSTDPPKDRQ